MEQNRKDQKFAQTPNKKTEMPERKREDISSGPKTTVRPEIDLPLKGGRTESDLSTRQQPKRDERVESDRSERSTR